MEASRPDPLLAETGYIGEEFEESIGAGTGLEWSVGIELSPSGRGLVLVDLLCPWFLKGRLKRTAITFPKAWNRKGISNQMARSEDK